MRKSVGELVKGRKTVIAKPGDSVLALCKRLRAANVGAAPVVKDGVLVGIFTERDLLKRVVAAGKNAKTLAVSKVMTKNPVTAIPRLTVLEGLGVMREHQCRHLPLVEDGKLLGIVSQRDIIHAILAMKEEEIEDLKQTLDLLPIEPGVG
ncbi:MAG: putative signal transduction [Planctomycetota bacterium]|nr:MAG: putative signal transduction [Planctomycetota bacterium]